MATVTASRSLTVSWDDPMITARASKTMSGLDFLRALLSGELPPPPISVLIGQRPVSAEPGRVVFEITPAEQHYNPIGFVHGGVITTVLDSVMGCTVHSTLPAGVGYTTLELKVNFVRPVTNQLGTLRCEGKIINSGKRVATVEASLTDAGGKLYAHATSTCMIFSADSA
jgi:uncharacterized protein (TIGR00369 family)